LTKNDKNATPKESTLHSKAPQSSSINKTKFKSRTSISADALVKGILKKDIGLLGRAITRIESTNPAHRNDAHTILERCLPHANASIRIGITGIPGVGKSTFIEALGMLLIQLGNRVAVLTIDPSSALSKGSILGDKTRMPNLASHTNAFIRPSATGDTLGGVARKTRDTITICEAAGFDIIIVETVGVGQSETDVYNMTDFFLPLKLAGTGDALQAMKRGVIELADAIVIHKADGQNTMLAKQAKNELELALQLNPKKASGWDLKIILASALEQKGIREVWELILGYVKHTKDNNYFETKRKSQSTLAVTNAIKQELNSRFFNDPKIKIAVQQQLKKVHDNTISTSTAIHYLLNLYKTRLAKEA
jgi:LAO/AO transport system kinase